MKILKNVWTISFPAPASSGIYRQSQEEGPRWQEQKRSNSCIKKNAQRNGILMTSSSSSCSEVSKKSTSPTLVLKNFNYPTAFCCLWKVIRKSSIASGPLGAAVGRNRICDGHWDRDTHRNKSLSWMGRETMWKFISSLSPLSNTGEYLPHHPHFIVIGEKFSSLLLCINLRLYKLFICDQNTKTISIN